MPVRPSLIVAMLLGVAAVVLANVPASTAGAFPAAEPTAAVPMGVAAVVPASLRSAGAGCGPAPQGQVAVSVVIDRGSGNPSVRCAVVPERSTGLDAMRAAGLSVRLDGGFVCAIDGLPATGCGNRPDAGRAYWRYWHAPPGGAWAYSQVGAGGYRLPTRCAVEGWVWSDAATADTPPRVAAPRPTCEAAPAPAPTAPSATVRPPPPVGGGGTPPPASTSGAPVAATPSPAPGSTPAADVAAGSAGPDSTAPPAVAGASTVAPGASESTDRAGEDGSDGGAPGESDDDAGGGAEGGVGPDDELASAPVVGEGSTPPPWGALIGVLLIAALGGAAVLRSRARSGQVGAEGS